MAEILFGKPVAERIYQGVKERLEVYRKGYPYGPALDIILANDNSASLTYVSKKIQTCEKLGIRCSLFTWLKNSEWDSPLEYVEYLLNSWHNADAYDMVNGIIVQLPVKDCDDPTATYSLVNPLKDVDCFHPENVGLLSQGRPRFLPCTPAGILEMLRFYDIPVKGKRFTVVNNSDIVGKPLSVMLTLAGATVSICHKDSDTEDVKDLCRSADVVVVAVGKPGFLTNDYVTGKTVVIDVGISRGSDGKIVGDCHPEIYDTVKAYSPSPKGVGPMTVACLMRNLITAAEIQR